MHCTEQAQVLSSSRYADVVEERNIEHLCGYPLCNAHMKGIPQLQKYHISVKNKQVYDLTERKVTVCVISGIKNNV